MIEQPHFRTVLRGLDPDQVSAAITELHSSLVDARRTAADRTIELAKMQEAHAETQAALDAARSQLSEQEQPQGDQPKSFHDLGSRIGTMLRLAEEEAAQLVDDARTSAQALLEQADEDAATRRAEAEEGIAEEIAREKGKLEELRSRSAALAQEVDAAEEHADTAAAELRERAESQAAQILQVAQHEAAQLRSDTLRELAAEMAERDRIHTELTVIARRIADLVGADALAQIGHADVDAEADEQAADAATEGPQQEGAATEPEAEPDLEAEPKSEREPGQRSTGGAGEQLPEGTMSASEGGGELGEEFDDSFDGEEWARQEQAARRR